MPGKIKIGEDWALFLDRDGVINKRLYNDYVKNVDEFEFIEGVTEALSILKNFFHPIIVVTNQQGIGKGLMTTEQLEVIHNHMITEIARHEGRIDKVFFSPDLKNTNSFTRKPAVGMALKSRKLFPSLHYKNCIMAGDSYSDILFGHRLGMTTVLIGSDKETVKQCFGILNYHYNDLLSFAGSIEMK